MEIKTLLFFRRLLIWGEIQRRNSASVIALAGEDRKRKKIPINKHKPSSVRRGFIFRGIAWLSEGVSDTDLSEADASIASHLTDGRCSSGQPRPSIKISPPYIIGQLVAGRALPRAPSPSLFLLLLDTRFSWPADEFRLRFFVQKDRCDATIVAWLDTMQAVVFQG
ncbi:hypothetical protein CEXT_588091 [Caerostris extrusa]|uniref:Uncharacterized protein n=1 Tax=Caerostris extrusa TaxID=172846 RepID=A0AAV4XEV5_CAEEX|nr:hypothetical protein CEXT_588091 [Caerostris extrusa]